MSRSVIPDLGPELAQALRREAMAELWRRRQVWPLLEALLDRDQLADARAIFSGVDIQKGQLPADDYFLDISRQRGKSWLCCTIAGVLGHCLDALFIKYAAQEKLSVRAIVEPTLKSLFMDCPLELRPVFDSQDNVWTWPASGSEMRAAGVNGKGYENLRGQKAHLVIKDESGFYDDYEATDRVLAPQLQTTKGFALDASTPSESPGHPATGRAMAAKARGRYSHRTIYNHPRMSPAEVEAFIAKEAAKKGLTVEAFKKTTYFKREFLCLHVVEETRAVVPEWSQEAEGQAPGTVWGDVLTAELPRPVFYDSYTCTDFGYTRDRHASLFGFYDFSFGRLVIEAEVSPPRRARLDVLADAYLEKAREMWPVGSPRPYPEAEVSPCGKYWLPYRALCDGSGRGQETLEDLAKHHDVHLSPALKGELEVRVNVLRKRVGEGRLFVHPRCVRLRAQLSMGLWADKARIEFERTSEGHLDELAALVDLANNLDTTRNPIPLGWGVDATNVVINSRPRGQAAALESAFGGTT
jgi:hypothetical protein